MFSRLSFPSSLTRRFALAAAGLAASALLLTSFASWWILTRQNDRAVSELQASKRQFHSEIVSINLTALSQRMDEVAGSTILATGLVDSAGRETYLEPFLGGLRHINGMSVQVLLADFEGEEIASNNATFSTAQRQWLRERLQSGLRASAIFTEGGVSELVAIVPLNYPRTRSSEGALLYKISLTELFNDDYLQLTWGDATLRQEGASTAVVVPAVFEPLRFQVRGAPSAQAMQPSLSPPYITIAGLTLTLFVALVLAGRFLAAVLTKDLRHLQNFSSRISQDGLGLERLKTGGTTEEVASLSSSINQMLDRLYEQHLALTSEGEKLKALADASKVADRRKDEFLAMLAHELRNPLAPIMAGAELLRMISAKDPKVARTGGIIAQQARHMATIVDDLIDVSRVTRGLITLKKETLDFASVVAVAIEQVRPLIQTSHHHLGISLPGVPMAVSGDKTRLVQAVSNLLSNAAKYTPQGGSIELKVVLVDAELVLTIQDNGSGIAPDFMPEIFDLFAQGERSPDRRQGGLGLGLALVKSLIAQHGGSISASSPGLGLGSVFTVRLPLGRVGELQAVLPPPVWAGPQTSDKPLKLWLVDDNVDAVQTLAMLLEMDGYEVLTSYDGSSTLQQVQEQSVDVFILDIGLPDMAGTELATQLRALPVGQGAKLIALTGYGQESDRARSLAAGFDFHLVKPVDYQKLTELLQTIHADGPAEAAESPARQL